MDVGLSGVSCSAAHQNSTMGMSAGKNAESDRSPGHSPFCSLSLFSQSF